MRAKIKAMNYGLAYGLSAFGLGEQLRIDPAEARGLMDEYFETFGGIRDYLGGIVDEARRSGFTETIMGRRRYLPDLTSDNRQRREMAERMALNAPIQGSAADLIKVAMLDVERAIFEAGLRSRMLLQVHDELVFEVAPGEQDALDAAGARADGRRRRADRAARRLGRHRPQLARGRSLSGSGSTDSLASTGSAASGTELSARSTPNSSRVGGDHDRVSSPVTVSHEHARADHHAPAAAQTR